MRMEDIGKDVCRRLHHNIGGTATDIGEGKCKVETEEATIVIMPNGSAEIRPKKDPYVKIALKYAKELRKVYEELGIKPKKEKQ